MKPTSQMVKNRITPPEEAAALAFKDEFSALHKGTHDRHAVTDSDRVQIAKCEAALTTLRDAVRNAWGGIGKVPNRMAEIAELMRGVVRTMTATTTTSLHMDGEDELVSKSIETPAIESQAVRAHLVRQGEQLLASVDDLIAQGVRRLELARARDVKLTEDVRFWLKDPTVRCALELMIRVENDPRVCDVSLDGVRECFYWIQRFISRGNNETEARILHTVVGKWREWIDVVRKELNAAPAREE